MARWLAEAESVVALTGAGVSTASGIPDFRGPSGLWTRDPHAERLASIDAYVSDPQVRRDAWRWRMDTDPTAFEPNPAHDAFVELQRLGRLEMLITQNVDGLHHRSGLDPDLIVEIHGSTREVVCLSCAGRWPMSHALDRVRAGESDPPCRSCGGMLKAATVSFGQSLDVADLERSQQAVLGCDVLLAAGSSLSVYPVAALPRIVVDAADSRLVVVNAEPTPYDEFADAVLGEDVTTCLPDLVVRVRDVIAGTS